MTEELRRFITLALGTLSAAAFIAYLTFQGWGYLQGPRVHIESPRDGAFITEPVIAVAGTASGISSIFLNGQTIYVDEAGRFSEPLLPLPGYSILSVIVHDRFGRTAEARVSIVAPTN